MIRLSRETGYKIVYLINFFLYLYYVPALFRELGLQH